MRQLSSTLSQPRRRIYGLLSVGFLVAVTSTLVGGLIFVLGRPRPDIIMPFSECGQYILLLGLVNLGLYGAVLWQVGRLTRRTPRKALESPSLLTPDDEPPASSSEPPTAAPRREPYPGQPRPGAPRQISRQVRGTPSSLRLDP